MEKKTVILNDVEINMSIRTESDTIHLHSIAMRKKRNVALSQIVALPCKHTPAKYTRTKTRGEKQLLDVKYFTCILTEHKQLSAPIKSESKIKY